MKHKEFKIRIPQPELRLDRPKLRHWLPSPGNVIFTLLMIGLLLWAQTAGAIPLPAARSAPDASSTNTISYQGRLADTSGTPVTALVNMEFRIYDIASGGAPLWEEFWTGGNAISVSDGLFNVMLGSLTPIPPNIIAQSSTLWLGVTAGTDDEMTPRVQLGSVPFAVRATHVSSLNAADGDPADAVRVDDDGNMLVNGNVGIGTYPQAKLDVDGSIRFRALPTPYRMTNLTQGCRYSEVYGLVYKFGWDPPGGSANRTDVTVNSSLAHLWDSATGNLGAGTIPPRPIQVCVEGDLTVPYVDIYYIPVTGYE